MPHDLHTDARTKRQRHVLSQQMYRLRTRYRLLNDNHLFNTAERVLWDLRQLAQQYESLGGMPVHKGNIL